jgi:hypothetical protein
MHTKVGGSGTQDPRVTVQYHLLAVAEKQAAYLRYNFALKEPDIRKS